MVMPATSLSVVMTVVDASSVPKKPPVPDAVAVRVVVISPSTTVSSTPAMVTVWAVFQFAVVKVSVSVSREFSVVSSPVMETVTVSVGSASRTTVNVEELPASVVRRSPPSVVPVWAMVMPLVSSSVFLTVLVAVSVPSPSPGSTPLTTP